MLAHSNGLNEFEQLATKHFGDKGPVVLKELPGRQSGD